MPYLLDGNERAVQAILMENRRRMDLGEVTFTQVPAEAVTDSKYARVTDSKTAQPVRKTTKKK